MTQTAAPTPVQTCVVIDGNSLAHRAFHAYSRAELTDSTGAPQAVRYGFLRILTVVAEKVAARHGSVDRLVVAFDSRANLRKEWDPGYKAGRSATDPSLHAQMDTLVVLLREAGITVTSVEGWEADDIAASAAALVAATPGTRLVVVTSDRDAIATVSERVEVLQLRNGMDQARFLDIDAVQEAYGVHPSRYVLLAALRGDKSDNLAGVPGLGPKKAAAVCERHASLDAMLADETLAALVGARAAAALVEHEAAVRHNIKMMAGQTGLETQVLDAALPSREQLTAALEAAELGRLAPGLARWLSATGAADAGPVTVLHPAPVAAEPVRETSIVLDGPSEDVDGIPTLF